MNEELEQLRRENADLRRRLRSWRTWVAEHLEPNDPMRVLIEQSNE